jgi:DNA-binding winged helix-turn-helix (wHTH) protein/predicted ATPase
MSQEQVCFEGYHLDPRNECVWRGEQALHLTTKAFRVLRYLVESAGQLVTKDALFQAVWPDIAVSDAALTTCIGEIRKALGDTAQAPRFIAMVHRRGYRFIAPVTPVALSATPAAPASPPLPLSPVPLSLLVGREAELTRLRDWLAQARRGARQVVFVTGEAGMGKTTVVDAFLATAASDVPVSVAWGQCIAHYGAGEAYLPVLDALGRLCRPPGNERLLALLGQYAPTWLVQMPALLNTADLEALQRRVLGTTRERMLRELAEALETMTVEQPLVLVLEDLHWSDHATLDLITWLARRREPAQLLLLGTYRPVDVIVHGHPLQAVKQDLALHRQCVELQLEGLSEVSVAAYLARRFPGSALPTGLARMLHQRTEGQPLFLVQVVDAWVQHGWVAEVAGQWVVQVGPAVLETGVPESMRQMIVQQLDGCSAEAQRVLEAASVVGIAFSTAAVEAGVEAAVGEVEEQCEALVRRGQFLEACGVEEWPDGTVAGRYGFVHALYQQVVYDRLPVGRRLALHRRIGLRLEAGYGGQASEQAAALAVHFDRGRDTAWAVHYLQQAAVNALGRYAYHEAVAHLTRALELLATLPETPGRAQQELDLRITLGPALMATRGLAAPEVEQTYTQARELCRQIGDTPHLSPTLRGLSTFYLNRGALPTARELGEQLVALAQREAVPMHLLPAHSVLGLILVLMGEYAIARPHFEVGFTLTDQVARETPALNHNKVTCLAQMALTLWCMGFPTQAVWRIQEALVLAQALDHPHTLVLAQHWAAFLHYYRHDAPAVQAQTESLLALATAQAFPLFEGLGTCWRGWALAMQGQGAAGLRQMHQGLAAVLVTGQMLSQSLCLVLLAEAAGYASQVEEGLRLLAEALTAMEASGRGDLLAEAYRLQGVLLLRQAVPDAAQAETCFQQALAIARQQQAKSWELRAATSLSRLWQRQGKRAAAQALLAPIHGWFTEGFDTTDLQEAQALLAELA